MILSPRPYTSSALSETMLNEDRRVMKSVRVSAGCHALYFKRFPLSRTRYVPYDNIERVYKRIAMTKGGFSGRGAFLSAAYIVIVLNSGVEEAIYIGSEEVADRVLEDIRLYSPSTRLLSKEGEKRRVEEERTAEKQRASLSAQAASLLHEFESQKGFLEEEARHYKRLERAFGMMRSYDISKPVYRYAATAIVSLGIVSALFGIISMVTGLRDNALYFVIFGIGAVLLFSGFSVIPSRRGSRKAIEKELSQAVTEMEEYITRYDGFALPACYAHPVVFERMCRIVLEGKASTLESCFSIMKDDLRAIDSSCTVTKSEYDEITAIKPMFQVNGWK